MQEFKIGEAVPMSDILAAIAASEMSENVCKVRGSTASGGTNPTVSLIGKILDSYGNRYQVSGSVSLIQDLTPEQAAERKLYKQLLAAKTAGVKFSAAQINSANLTDKHKADLLA
jgi:hypothetical protein